VAPIFPPTSGGGLIPVGTTTRIVSTSYAASWLDETVAYTSLTGSTVHTLPPGAGLFLGFEQFVERWDNGGNDLLITPSSGDSIEQGGSGKSYYVGAMGERVLCRVIALTGAGAATWAIESNLTDTFYATTGWIAIPANGTRVGSRMMMGGKRSVKYAAIQVDAAVTGGSITVQPAVNGSALGAGNEALSAGTSGIARQAIGNVLTTASSSPWSLDIIVGQSALVGPANMCMTVALW
jgi:hypothetical protein